ncbi:Leucine Rich repeats (2 copies)/Leucine Rich repeat [Corynebacterium kutscheri]|uniref:Leucine Rich repeats (2 copies)/Leucine Rich repeat n=2 Tax=Corynebacterium kutscheri TaxID=35755 RepID=A0A0F6R0Y7_9CORY|nr:leucine-rich repeat domain-containing protein [Corynebacterium kutscheri]AKE40723.1 Leucine Rich repeats (2 copies)/Leucine Rich repeat [Corynebacterium kutscheri]VEH11120.1 Internalin-A precursor [Corynebacterium kutscheri]
MADDTPQDFKQTSVVQYDDIKLEMRDGLLVVSAFNGKHTEGSHTLFGFYRGEKADPFIAVLKVKDSHVEPGEPQFWRFYPGKVKNDGQPKKKLDHSQSDPADIVDPTLAKCIRYELDMQESETITISHVQSIGSLNCTGANRSSKDKITTLKGMEHATGLELLNIRGHRITDLTPLANSKKLQSIDVSANRLTSLQGLENKPQLNNIRATTNKITDVSALSQHKEMEYLYLDNNQLTNLNGLAESTEVENLHLAHNKLTDVSRLKSFLWLRDLDLSGNQLEDVATFTEHRALTTVNLEKNKISEFTKVDWAKKGLLQTLCIADNPISDEAELKKSLGDKLKDCPDVEVEVPEEDPPAAAPKDEPKADPQPKPMGNFAEKLKKFIPLILPIGAVYVVLFHLFAGVIQDFVRRFMP